MKVAFIIPVWYDQNGGDPNMSAFLMPQIDSLTPYLESYELIYLEMGFGYSTLKAKVRELKNFKKKSLDHQNWVVFSMYGSLHGFLVQCILGGKFKIVNTFGGSDILGSTNSGFFWSFRNRLTKILSLYTAKRVNHVIVKSTNLANALRPIIRTPITIVPNGVNLELFRPLENRDGLRAKFEWNPEEFIVLFSLRRENSKLEAVKNYPLAKEVISKFAIKAKVNTRCEIISNKSHKEMVDLFNAADCLLLTSLHEGSPNIIKEAMACNLPIVSVECGDVKIRLERVRNSYVSSKYDSEELAELLLKVKNANQRSNGREELKRQGLESGSIANTILYVFKEVGHYCLE